MSVDDPVIITCAISGAIANRAQCPAIPYTPAEYAAEARRIVDAGGAMIHIHARTPEGVPSYEIEDFRAITEAIREAAGDVIINYSTGAIGIPVEKRLAYLRELRPDVAAEFDDTALLKVFGQAGVGVFAGPAVLEDEVARQYKVEPIGRADGLVERFYAISGERRIKHPGVVAISTSARAELFA